jgi:hypothetical protein
VHFYRRLEAQLSINGCFPQTLCIKDWFRGVVKRFFVKGSVLSTLRILRNVEVHDRGTEVFEQGPFITEDDLAVGTEFSFTVGFEGTNIKILRSIDGGELTEHKAKLRWFWSGYPGIDLMNYCEDGLKLVETIVLSEIAPGLSLLTKMICHPITTVGHEKHLSLVSPVLDQG